MTNIGAINSKHTKTYGVTKNYGLPWKFVTPCCQMAWHGMSSSYGRPNRY
jgi:hypothetical protein